MKLIDAFDLAATMRPKWRTRRGAWCHPWGCNRGHCLRILGETKNIKKITKEYLKSGWMLIDFMATFPFNVIYEGAFLTRLFRLMRLSKLIKLFDVSKIKRLIKNYYDKSTRADRIQSQQIAMYTYKIIRLILIALIVTY